MLKNSYVLKRHSYKIFSDSYNVERGRKGFCSDICFINYHSNNFCEMNDIVKTILLYQL